MWFLYKQEGNTYEHLLATTREADSEFSKGRGTSVKAKAATASAGTSKNPAIGDISERIDKLVVIFMSASLNQNNSKNSNGYP